MKKNSFQFQNSKNFYQKPDEHSKQKSPIMKEPIQVKLIPGRHPRKRGGERGLFSGGPRRQNRRRIQEQRLPPALFVQNDQRGQVGVLLYFDEHARRATAAQFVLEQTVGKDGLSVPEYSEGVLHSPEQARKGTFDQLDQFQRGTRQPRNGANPLVRNSFAGAETNHREHEDSPIQQAPTQTRQGNGPRQPKRSGKQLRSIQSEVQPKRVHRVRHRNFVSGIDKLRGSGWKASANQTDARIRDWLSLLPINRRI